MLEPAARSGPAVPTTAWMKPLPPALRFIFHGDARARAVVGDAWGVAFAEQACRSVIRGSRATLWLGPDEYLLFDAADGSAVEAASALQSALGTMPHALVNVSHRQFALEVSGPQSATILSGACPLDLDLGEFPVGMCTRTALAKADIVLWRIRDDAFHLEVWRSFADYVVGLLSEIAAEYYGR